MYNSKMTIGELLENPNTREVLKNFLGEDMLNNPMLDSAKGMTLDGIKPHVAGMLPDGLLEQIEAALEALN